MFQVSALTGFGSWNNITVTLPATYDITDEVLSPNSALATLIINSNGTGSGTLAVNFNWARPNFTGVGNDYEVILSVSFSSGGGTLSGTVDTWLPLTTNRSWTLTKDNLGTATRICVVSIRRIGGQTESQMVPTFSATVNNE